MSTANFITQKDFDMYVINFEVTEEDIKSFETENECEFDYEFEAQCFYDFEIDNFKWLLNHALTEKFKRTLEFFNVELKDGYYTGVQTYIKLQSENPYELDNEDCHYYFDMNRSTAIRKYDSEIRFINKKLLPYIRDNSSFERLVCDGIFSNGEAIYSYPDRIKQAA